MQLTSLSVQHVRRIAAAQISPADQTNLISGPNGSGKTSLLESIHYLATARSFRASRVSEVISHGQTALIVSGELKDSAGVNSRVGVEKTSNTTRLRINGEAVTVASTIARLVPVLTFNTESYSLLNGGPANRRALLDRLLFHVEPEYLRTLKTYYRGLKQRNALLRANTTHKQVVYWDHQLEAVANRLDRWRGACISTLNEYICASALNERIGSLELEYRRGWVAEESFSNLLAANSVKDRDAGTTTVGPHRAELRIKVGGKLAKTVVSRGQGKLIIATIVSAQARFIREYALEPPILLVDDLASELDRSACQAAVDALISTKAQIFFTAIESSDLPASLCESAKVFHVEHGQVHPTVMDQ
ncbi:MAG: DNA replication/repair protein RecF [Proteobacteria bacterium]|nr:MAG: DNA replication/repair protein RecF [Pseudomonadota bacterium]